MSIASVIQVKIERYYMYDWILKARHNVMLLNQVYASQRRAFACNIGMFVCVYAYMCPHLRL